MLSLPGALLCRLLLITCKHSHSNLNREEVACFALVEQKQFLHGYSTIVIQLYHSDSSTRVYTADGDDSLFLYCKFKGSLNFDTHSGPYQALSLYTACLNVKQGSRLINHQLHGFEYQYPVVVWYRNLSYILVL